MPLWFTLLLSIVMSLALGITAVIGYITLSISRAAPLMRSRFGQPAPLPIRVHTSRQLTLNAIPPRRRTPARSGWINAH